MLIKASLLLKYSYNRFLQMQAYNCFTSLYSSTVDFSISIAYEYSHAGSKAQ